MAAALDYCRTLASATPGAVQLTEAAYDAQVKLINSAAAYYGARTNASEAVAKVSQFNVGTSVQIADMTTRNAQFNSDALIKVADLDKDALRGLAELYRRFLASPEVRARIGDDPVPSGRMRLALSAR